MNPAGSLALVLHGHLPFVRHPEYERFLEEDWLHEAVTECYLPVLDVLCRLAERGVRYRITIGLSPPLLSMLGDPLLMGRMVQYLERTRRLAEKELLRTRRDKIRNRLAGMYVARLGRARRLFLDRFSGDLVAAFAGLARSGHLEIITSAATHAFLPLLQSHPEGVRAQLQVARQVHQRAFACEPQGIWLPECGYYSGLDRLLAEAGYRYFFVDAHGLLNGTSQPRYGVYQPAVCPAGVAVLGRDLASSRQVWSAETGYPGHAEYREFYRDVGFDLDLDYLKPFIQTTGERKATGIKYHRVTGRSRAKALYRPERARTVAREHARHFLAQREAQVEALAPEMGTRTPVIVAPYDLELFGHWWYEGPQFLEAVLTGAQQGSSALELVTSGDVLDRASSLQELEPSPSSWGSGGHSQVWIDESNDWIYNHVDHAMAEMIQLANGQANSSVIDRPLFERAAAQSARELMLAQASDWAFILKTGTSVDYAKRRICEHLANFQRLSTAIRSGRLDVDELQKLEDRNCLFPEIDYRVFRRTAVGC